MFDFITGIIKGIKADKRLNSTKLRDGLFKKVGFVLCYILAIGINITQEYIELPFTVNLLPVIVAYVVITEIISIIENICAINSDLVPDNLKKLIGFKGVEK